MRIAAQFFLRDRAHILAGTSRSRRRVSTTSVCFRLAYVTCDAVHAPGQNAQIDDPVRIA